MKHVFQLAVLFSAMTVAAQQRLTIVIDPARGGTEYGARIDAHTYEKQVTLDLANRLKSLLTARDFDVVMTRDNDVLVTNDQRAALANQAKPIACLLLHSTSSGTGLHLFTSSLPPAGTVAGAVLWDEAQSPFVQRSERLKTELAAAFTRSKIAVSSGRTWIRPLDNMECPALAIEVAPENDSTNAADRTYQTRIADAIASSMLLWRNHADVVQSVLSPPPAHESPAAAPKAPPSSPAESNPKTTPAPAKPASTPAVPPADTARPLGRKPASAGKPAPASAGKPAPASATSEAESGPR